MDAYCYALSTIKKLGYICDTLLYLTDFQPQLFSRRLNKDDSQVTSDFDSIIRKRAGHPTCTLFYSPNIMTLQNIKKEGDYSCIDHIGEHGADDGNDEEWLDGIAVFIAYGTHVGHRIGCCTKAETTNACT